MKKKVALLLTLVMVFGLIPMNMLNVAANAAVLNPRNAQRSGAAAEGDGYLETFRVSIPSGNFAGPDLIEGLTPPVSFHIRFTGTNTNRVGAVEAIPTGAFNVYGGGVAGFNAALANNPVTRLGDNVATIELTEWLASSPGALATFSGNTVIEVPARFNRADRDAMITIDFIWVQAGNIIHTATLINNGRLQLPAPADIGVEITVGSARSMVNAVQLDNITITETRAGSLIPAENGATGVTYVALIAPRGFGWSYGDGVIGRGYGVRAASATAGANITTADLEQGTGFVSGPDQSDAAEFIGIRDGRDVMFLRVDWQRGAGPLAIQQRIGFHLQRLWLIAGPDVLATNNVYVDVRVFTSRTAGAAFPGILGVPASNEAVTGEETGIRQIGSASRLVATMGATEILVNVPGNVANLVSGRAGQRVGGNAGGVGYRAIGITESMPGTIMSGPATEIYRFALVQPGVRFDNRAEGGHLQVRRGSGDTAGTWQSFADSPAVVGQSGLDAANRVLTLIAPPWEAPAGQIRRLDVRFNLSIEAGFAGTHGDEIEVDVFLPNGTVERHVIANVSDPITVDAGEAVTTLGGWGISATQQIPNITISETDYGIFEVGDEIWVYVVPTIGETDFIANHALGFGFVTGETAQTNSEGSGLLLSEFVAEDIFLGGGMIVPGWRATVLRNSVGEPGTITLVNNWITGMLTPGVNYQLVVGGPRIAPNSHITRANNPADDLFEYSPAMVLREDPTSFAGLPYATTILSVVNQLPQQGTDNEDGPGPNGGFARVSLNINTMMNIGGESMQAVAFPTVAPGIVSSMVGFRVFGYLLGVEPDWDEVTNTATFSSYNIATGAAVTVSLTQGSTNVVINGNSYDIAVRAGQPELAGHIMPQNFGGRLFVPARVLADAFGIPVDFQAGNLILG